MVEVIIVLILIPACAAILYKARDFVMDDLERDFVMDDLERDFAMDERIIKSYVWHGDDCFFISTIFRDSSVPMSPPPRELHTLVWTLDWETGQRGEQIWEGFKGFEEHMDICRQLRLHGHIDERAIDDE